MNGPRRSDRPAAETFPAHGPVWSQAGRQGESQALSAALKSEKGEQPCLWMQAGIVRQKFCQREYRCEECAFESALRRADAKNTKLREQGRSAGGKGGRIRAWEEKMKTLPPARRPCIHSLKKEIRFKSCTNDYRCANCEFDQYFQDEFKVHAVVRPVNYLQVEGFTIPQGYYLHEGHAWARIEEGPSVRIGIDDFALRLLGPFDAIESPLVGKKVAKGQPHVALKRGSKQAGVACPLSGVVTAVNARLADSPKHANETAYSEGWVMTLHPENLRDEVKDLMIAQESMDFLARELERLHRLIEEVGGPLAADGGQLGKDLYGTMPRLGWERLVETFLRT